MKRTLLALSLSLFTAAASAHITIEQPTAIAGSYYKAVFKVPHGCSGSPTRAITVFVPEGVMSAKPMPKAGWTLEVKNEKLTKPYESHGKPIYERPASISWSGGKLLDSEYDEFIMQTSLPANAGAVSFRVLQQCEEGQIDWAEAQVKGKTAPRFPAPVLEVTPAKKAGHHHH